MNELKQYIISEIEKIDNNHAFIQRDALVLVNSPLALTQIGLKSRRRALEDVLQHISESRLL